MKGGFKHLPSEETGRIKTLLEHLSFLLSNSLKSTGSTALPLVSTGSSHKCQQKPPQEEICLCWCSLPASHKKKKEIKEKYRELSEGKIILNLHLAKHKASSLLPLSLGRLFLSPFMFTLEFSACFLRTWAGFDSHSRYYQENNEQVIFTFRCLKLPLMFHYKHIQRAGSAHSATWKELRVEVSHSRILLWI